MRATTQLVLVLMGGGVMAGGTAMSMQSSRACQDARARQDPRAEQICRSWTGGWHGSSSHGWFGRSGGLLSSRTSSASVARGGFGFMGMHFGGFHG